MELRDEGYSVISDDDSTRVVFAGALRLNGNEGYAEIAALLDSLVEAKPASLLVDLSKLEFLNSSGINTLYNFVIRARDTGVMQLVVEGSNDIAWQSKSLRNLLRLMPGLELKIS